MDEHTEERLKLEQAVRRFREVTDDLEAARAELHAAIVEAMRAGMKTAKIEELVPYDRQHLYRIRKAANLPTTRRPTVQRIPREEAQ